MDLRIADCLFIHATSGMGRGVFTNEDLPENVVIEISPVLVMSAADRKLLDQTPLHDYIFEWGEQNEKCCAAWGYVSMYNHSFESNCEYFMDFEKEIIIIKTVRKIKAFEELLINYNGDFDNKTALWFDAQ